jgi:YebC/PmpR family DNA-binding regulatory protein
MSGHSHWASIRHKKGAVDAKRGKLFSKLAKNITVAARTGGGNPADNLRLRYAIDKAKAESMPKDSIDRAVKKGTGDLGGGSLEELVYEGIGPGGVSLIIDLLTDNRNRTSSELRSIFDKRGGSLGKSGSVSWKFDRKGVLSFPRALIGEEELYEAAIEAGAENIAVEDESYLVTTKPAEFDAVRSALQKVLEARRPKSTKHHGGDEEEGPPVFTRAELEWIPQATVPVDAAKAPLLLQLLSELEEHEDVQNVSSDFDLPEEVLKAALAKA